MEIFFLSIVVLMLGLAVFDLIVGVSNDAVNFLTSAIGAKAAPFKRVMMVASIGVVVGAVASGGMMGLAKNGMLTPSLFSVQDLLFIYVVVMLTDVFLLDLFNSVRLPTSTTVSIVFELLGATLAVSFMKLWHAGMPVNQWFTFLNGDKAITVILAIFVSVALAFTGGWLVQFLMRALMTFDYKRYMKVGGPLFGGVSIVVILNFILSKGLKNSPLRDHAVLTSISDHALLFYGGIFVGAVLYYLIRGRNEHFDPFREITMFGTFALAMAFASNDLVNFIGVPMAGLEAYTLWQSAGGSANAFMMTAFEESGSPSNMLYLFIAGLIMVATLWRSKKARNVISTSVELSRQVETVERFRGNDLARGVVRLFSFLASAVARLVPTFLRQAIDRRYTLVRPKLPGAKDGQPPAFDMIRASVNLMVAAVVITLGTANKLPLSTTYVTFMVVMGTSLADRAWNRDSAVYRVSGVFTVVGGWFFTALSAMTLTAIFGVIVYSFSAVGVALVIALVVLGIYLVNRFTETDAEVTMDLGLPEDWTLMEPDDVKRALHAKVRSISADYAELVATLVNAILQEDAKAIKGLAKRIAKEEERNAQFQNLVADQLRTLDLQHIASGKAVLEYFVRRRELTAEIRAAVDAAAIHVLNLHHPLDDHQADFLRHFSTLVSGYDKELQSDNKDRIKDLEALLEGINDYVETAVAHQVEGLSQDRYGYRNSQLFLGTFIGHLNAANVIHRMHKKTFVKNHPAS